MKPRMTSDARRALDDAGFTRRAFLKGSGALIVTFASAAAIDRVSGVFAQGFNGTGSNQSHGFHEHQANHVVRLRSYGHSDANLARSPRYFIRKQPIKPKARQQQGQEPKQAGEPGSHFFREYLPVNCFCFGGNAEDGQIVALLIHNVFNCRNK